MRQAARRNVNLVIVHAIDDRLAMVWDVELEREAFDKFVQRQLREVDRMVAEVSITPAAERSRTLAAESASDEA